VVTYSTSAVAGGDHPGLSAMNTGCAADIGNGYRPIWGQGVVS
jgi:hypothetical protein